MSSSRCWQAREAEDIEARSWEQWVDSAIKPQVMLTHPRHSTRHIEPSQHVVPIIRSRFGRYRHFPILIPVNHLHRGDIVQPWCTSRSSPQVECLTTLSILSSGQSSSSVTMFCLIISRLSDDILMSHSLDRIFIWQWLGFRRFFRIGQFEAIYPEPQRTDFNDSREFPSAGRGTDFGRDSFMVIAKYPIAMSSWYHRPSVHHAFEPDASEDAAFEANPYLVPDILIAMGVDSRIPEIQVFNPLLAKDDDPPDPITERRYESEADGDEESEEGDGVGERDEVEEQNLLGTTHGIHRIKLNFSGPRLPDAPPLLDENTTPRKKPKREKKRKKDDKGKGNMSLLPWSLPAKEFPSIWKSLKNDVQYKKDFSLRGPVIGNVAFSPRGAKWIVGVGEAESVYIWRMRDYAQEK